MARVFLVDPTGFPRAALQSLSTGLPRWRRALILASLLAGAWTSSAAALDVVLTVVNREGIARPSRPARHFRCLSRGVVSDVARLRLVRDGVEVPAPVPGHRALARRQPPLGARRFSGRSAGVRQRVRDAADRRPAQPVSGITVTTGLTRSRSTRTQRRSVHEVGTRRRDGRASRSSPMARPTGRFRAVGPSKTAAR